MHTRAGLQFTNPGYQNWANYPGVNGAAVDAVFTDAYGRTRVNVQLTRTGQVLRSLLVQTPHPSVGDWGFVTYVDGRRDTPVFVGVISQAQTLQAATVSGVSSTTVDVLVPATQQTLAGIPFLVPPGTQLGTDPPAVGYSGVVGYLNGLSSTPVYLGKLSTA